MKTWRRSADRLTVVAALLLIAGVLVALLGYAQSHGRISLGWLVEELYANFGTELIGIAITVLVIDRLALQRQESRDEMRLKADLIARAGSGVRETAVAAIDELARLRWLYDGTLREANLKGANLKGAVLHATYQGGANLSDAHLQDADLSEMRLYEVLLEQADLQRANLSKAQLVNANLAGANLDYADLQGACLLLANLEGARLFHTKIQGAMLWNANLEGAKNLADTQLAQASRLRDATMPDGRRYDGRYSLAGDLQDAKEDGIDISADEAMAKWYGVALKDYQLGQKRQTPVLAESAVCSGTGG